MILGDIILNNAAVFPAKEDVVDDIRRISFGQLAERAKRLANALAARGARRGDRVAIVAQNCHEYIEVFGACEMAGYVAAPMNFRLTVPELQYLLTDCRPVAVVFDYAYTTNVKAVRGLLEGTKAFICIDGACDATEDYESVLASANPTSFTPGFPAWIGNGVGN